MSEKFSAQELDQLLNLKLETANDVSKFLKISKPQLLFALYRASDEQKYDSWEIPKRSGGMRRIDSPRRVIRDGQKALLPYLEARQNAHPASHGFLSDRGIVTNADAHKGQRIVLNIDLANFFPSVNFGRVRGLLMKPPFEMGEAAATICAQLCTFRNGLPQGACTSPILSNFIATSLDRRLLRLARATRMRYSRYADDITFSTNAEAFPEQIVKVFSAAPLTDEALEAAMEGPASKAPKPAAPAPKIGPALERALTQCGFKVNPAKVRVQRRDERQTVTGLTVNQFPNVERRRIRRIRAMIHAWEKFGLQKAGHEHFHRYAPRQTSPGFDVARAFRNAVYGQLAFVKMVRGAEDPVFLKLCSKLTTLDPNPSKFIRRMVFGADDYDVFISHAAEDKDAVARPVFEACERMGLKAFLDEAHIGWGENYTTKINAAMGSARCVLLIISSHSASKPWPLAEINTALSLEVIGEKMAAPLVVGKPDLSKIPLIKGKDYIEWSDNPDLVARRLKDL
ncbi:MAG: TIR domain-containing protein, partial [Rhodobacteraceae bacterium]|nr:TIR domain-containing protein [Paracoccaceae bacterium]